MLAYLIGAAYIFMKMTLSLSVDLSQLLVSIFYLRLFLEIIIYQERA